MNPRCGTFGGRPIETAFRRLDDIIPIADKRERFSLKVAVGVFEHRQDIADGLAGMRLVGETVDDRDNVMEGQFIDGCLRDRSADDEIAILGENSNEISDGFPFSPAGIAGQIDCGTAELCHAGFEADPCAQACFLEDQSARSVLEQVWTLSRLQFRLERARPGNDGLELNVVQVEQGPQVLHVKRG